MPTPILRSHRQRFLTTSIPLQVHPASHFHGPTRRAISRSYILQRAVDGGFTQGVQNYALNRDATSYLDASAAVGVTYHYQLIAVNPLGASSPTAATVATILPPAPVLLKVMRNDGNAARTAITSATLVFSAPVALDTTMVSLIQNPAGAAVSIPLSAENPTGDGMAWVISWTLGTFNNALPDGAYSLTVHGASVVDRYGQNAGGDQTTNFNSTSGPVITGVYYYNNAPPHSLSVTFSQDVSASLTASSLKLSPAVSVAGFSWNASTLTGTWTYNGALPDAKYTVQFTANTVFNSDGVSLDGNADGIPGDAFSYSFTQVKPTLTLSGAANVNVGAPYSLNLGAITDAGQSSPSYIVHWGDGTTSTYANAGVVNYTYSSAVGPIKIVVDVVDANGTHTSAATLSLSVSRATVALSGSAYANPGATYTLNLGTVTDAGFTVSQYIVHWGDGTTSTYSTNGPVTHSYTNAKTTAVATAITVDLVDNSGAGSANYTNTTVSTLPLTINATPSVPVTGDFNANVGGTYRLILSAPTDTGFSVSQLTVNWGDGSPTNSVPPPTGTNTTLLTHSFTTPTAPSTATITIALTDNSGGAIANAGSLKVTVNPAPTVALVGSVNANAGGTYLLNVASAVEVGQTVSSYTINWGDGSQTVSPTPGNFTHSYAVAGSALIAVDVKDATGTFAAAGSKSITINNAPTVALSGNPHANTNGLYTLNLGAVNDPGQGVTQYQVRWGDGVSDVYGPGSTTATHTYVASGSDTINVDLTDGTGVYLAAGMLPVTVSPPSVSLTGNTGAFLGQGYALTINSANDPGGTPSQYVVDWGDGSTSSYNTSGTVNHVFAQHVYASPKSVIITTDLVDNTGTFLNAGSLPITIAPPPTVNLIGASYVTVNTTYSMSLGAVNDAIGTISSYIVHWGDNTSNTYTATATASHVYNTAGPVTIVVDTIDQNGTYPSAASLALSVNQPVTAPSIVGNPIINGDNPALIGPQRSMVDSILYTFSQAVNIASANAFSITLDPNVQTGTVPTLNWSALNPNPDGSSTQWVVTFSDASVIANSIADGVYDITINSAAITLDQYPQVALQPRATDVFSRLYADVNGDNRVSGADYNAFLSANGLRTGADGFIAGLDANGDGRIGGADYNAFLFNNGKRLSGFTATLVG